MRLHGFPYFGINTCRCANYNCDVLTVSFRPNDSLISRPASFREKKNIHINHK